MARGVVSWTTVKVRIEADTREQLALAAKSMQIELKRVRELKRPGLRELFFGVGIHRLKIN